MDDGAPNPRAERRGAWRDALIVTGMVAVYALVALRLQSHWWFEDDAYQIAYVSRNRPWEFFLSRDALERGLVGLLFTPLQNLSYWIDGWIARRSPGFAYAHTIVALWLAMLVWRAVLAHWIGRRSALALVGLTLLLPATIVAAEFISVRNYLEGLFFALAAIRLTQLAIERTGAAYAACVAGAVVCAFLGALAKELYVTTPFAVILCLFAAGRRWTGATAIAAAGVAYIAYYRAVIGALAPTFTWPSLSASDYPGFLWRYPYIFAGGPWGWAVAAACLAAVGYGVWRRLVRLRDVGLALLFIAIAFASMHPAAAALDRAYQTRGTWYRVSFVSSLVMLAGSAWLIRTLPRAWRATVAISAAVCLAIGAAATIRTWDGLKAQYGREGKFYLANPDKLIYSEVPAWWFLVGVDDLYQVASRHYVIAARPGQPGDAELLAKFGTVWRYSSVIGGYFPAPDIYKQLKGAP